MQVESPRIYPFIGFLTRSRKICRARGGVGRMHGAQRQENAERHGQGRALENPVARVQRNGAKDS